MVLTLNDLFIETLEDLEGKIKKPNDYKMLRAAGLIRQLIGEGGSSLINQVNNSKMELRFTVKAERYKQSLINSVFKDATRWNKIAPIDGLPVTNLSQAEFLQHTILSIRGDRYSVINTIRTASHILGGVHLARVEQMEIIEEREKKLIKETTSMEIAGVKPIVESIYDISYVLIDAVKPLKEDIFKKRIAAGN